jgi:two-component system phosphate regulon response regulator PhoB
MMTQALPDGDAWRERHPVATNDSPGSHPPVTLARDHVAMPPETILVCEDESDIVATIDYALRKEGFAVRVARTGAEAMTLAHVDPHPSLVLLDLMLPDIAGMEVCRRLKRDPQLHAVPVVMLTARTDEIDRVVGFEVGADDYVTKPFSVRELVLRIRAVLRRTAPPSDGPTAVRLGRLQYDSAGHRVWVDGKPIDLTAIEFRLLGVFVERRGRALSRDAIVRDTWGSDHHVTLRAIDTHVKRLRQKLGPAGACIETLRGVGYRMRRDDEPVE